MREATDYLDDLKVRGIKLHPLLDAYFPDDPVAGPLIELLIARDLPVLIHSGQDTFSEPWPIEKRRLP